ncbi:MAG: alpha/beta fold hydrolase [Rubricoccaceae bacterium]|nr:alpha/beta fold hydrolase [Rubricoccaceae bacterium]
MPASETVLLFHGLGRTAWSMRRLADRLRREGYRAINVDYPSRSAPIASLADDVVGARVERALDEGARRVHFVTHSLGGILVRHWTERHPPPEGARAVMIAPPHGGSEAADWARRVGPFCWWCGPALQELGTDPESVPAALGPLAIETGVIAGSRNRYPFFGRLFDGTTDGLVAVERARAEGIADFLVVPHGHTFLMRAPAVLDQTVHFLQHGRFAPPDGPVAP